MELLLAALPMAGCAFVMALTMRMMRAGRAHQPAQGRADQVSEGRRAALEALGARPGERSS
ncbi:MAG: hypothetical protein ACLGI2_07945 [Acidimicrobiia bacterium]